MGANDPDLSLTVISKPARLEDRPTGGEPLEAGVRFGGVGDAQKRGRCEPERGQELLLGEPILRGSEGPGSRVGGCNPADKIEGVRRNVFKLECDRIARAREGGESRAIVIG